jgi:hypothetical protein
VNHGIEVPLNVTQPRCDGTPPLDVASFHTIAKTPTQTVLDRTGAVPTSVGVPPGNDVVIVVEALDSSGVIIARAHSTHLHVTDTALPEQTLVLYPVGRFTKVCTTLQEARSGHTATRLADGQVLIAGGRGVTGGALASMERLGSALVVASGSLAIQSQGQSFPVPRSRHAALLVEQTGQVYFSGGEAGTVATPTPLSTHLFTDPQVDFAIGALGPQNPPRLGRTRHVALHLDDAVLLVGGMTRPANGSAVVPSEVVERLELSTATMTILAPLPEAREDASIALLGRDVLVMGGTGGGVSRATIDVLPEGDATHARHSSLLTPRAGSAVTVVGSRALVAGGLDNTGAMTGSTEWVTASSAVAGPNLAPRTHACAVTLGERVLIVGGEDATGPSAAAELIEADGSVTTVAFPGAARVDHACVALEDGGALIVGGLGSSGALDDLWQFTAP